jgi:hypothetical protein
MKKLITIGLASVTLFALMTGCGQSVPGVSSKSNFDECGDINKKLIQVDQFLINVDNTSAFHLEEAAYALENPRVSTSNNKKEMLKDGNRKKAKLLEEQRKLGCKPQTKK